MNWVADENIDSIVVERLRAAGHRVRYVAEASPGAEDEQVLREAEASRALLLTADKDFAAVCFRRRSGLAGVALLRLAGMSADEKAARLVRMVAEGNKRLLGAICVVGPRSWRIRARKTTDS